MKFFQSTSMVLASLLSLTLLTVATPVPINDRLSEVEKRQSLGAEHAMETLSSSLIQGIIGGIQADNERREAFTQGLIKEMRDKNPEFNWVVCHPKHETKFEGERGVDWDHKHEEFDITIGGTIGYEVYNFKAGEFTRFGDGGFINWAFGGNVVSRDQGGAHVVFAAPE